MTSEHNDLTLAEIADLVDVFYIGGTKHGLLFGEAIVIINPELQSHFRFYLKQKGALLAKGRVLGIQFLTLFQDNLFFELGKHANQMATQLAQGIQSLGFNFLTPPVSNQIFPVLPVNLAQKLHEIYGFYDWKKINSQQVAIRLVTSWATQEKYIKEFITDLKDFRETN